MLRTGFEDLSRLDTAPYFYHSSHSLRSLKYTTALSGLLGTTIDTYLPTLQCEGNLVRCERNSVRRIDFLYFRKWDSDRICVTQVYIFSQISGSILEKILNIRIQPVYNCASGYLAPASKYCQGIPGSSGCWPRFSVNNIFAIQGSNPKKKANSCDVFAEEKVPAAYRPLIWCISGFQKVIDQFQGYMKRQILWGFHADPNRFP